MSSNKTVNILNKLISNVYVLYFKTHSFHWNIIDHDFRNFHLMLEEHYLKFFDFADAIAERIRALGSDAPYNLVKTIGGAAVKEENSLVADSGQIVKILINDFETVIKEIKDSNSSLENNDLATIDLLTEVLAYLEKSLWMLKSSL